MILVMCPEEKDVLKVQELQKVQALEGWVEGKV